MAFDPSTHDFAHSAVRLGPGKLARTREEYDRATGGPSATGKAATDTAAPTASDAAQALAAEHGLDLATVTGTGKGGNVTKADVEKALAAAGAEKG